MATKPTVVFLAPLAPAARGNGLAMRAGMMLEALSAVARVSVVVVPVSERIPDPAWARSRAHTVTVVGPVAPDDARVHTTRQLADPELRERLRRTAPLPRRAAVAPPTLAETVAGALPNDLGRPAAVLGMRLYLAPLAVRLAQVLSAVRVVVDADDDDGTLLRALGEPGEADAFDRLARCWLPDADTVMATSAADAEAIAGRAGLDTMDVVPNSVVVPASVPAPPQADRVLFVGNLTYEPNRAAASLLVEEILPALRRRRPTATLDLVGAHGAGLAGCARSTGVRLTGAVPDVASYYAGADVVAAPLRHGAGARIKVIEAFAHRRPVVATTTATAGLELENDVVVTAESAGEMARAIDLLLREPARAAAMVDRALGLVARRYSLPMVAPLVRTAVLGPAEPRKSGGTAAA